MFNKKGDHVDWALSMGIFLLYLIGLFILLRPGITPVYDSSGILQILETNLMKEVTYEVREIPLIVELCKGDFMGECMENRLNLEDLKKNFDVKGPKDEKGLDISDICGCSIDQDPKIISSNKVYYYTYSQKTLGNKEVELDPGCKSFKDKEHCLVKLGASTTKTGVNSEWIGKIKTEKYEDLKKRWNVPIDFAIYYGDTSNILEESNKIISGQKIEGVNVFAKEIKTNQLSSNGALDPKIIIIQVW